MPRSVVGLLCDTGQLVSSRHLCSSLSLFLTFDNFHFWTLPYFLSVQNIAQSSAVLSSRYCGGSISEEKDRSTSLRLLLGAVSIAL